MQLEDYLIDHQAFDWKAILREWSWLLPKDEFTIWLMNRYGDLFLVFDDQTVHLLDIGSGSIEQIAESRNDFYCKIDESDNANIWLMIPLIDSLVKNGKLIQQGRCYSFIIPPVLGGEYIVENTATLNILEHYGVYASIHNQIKDLPDGTHVRFSFKA
jgi:hypothetical protein